MYVSEEETVTQLEAAELLGISERTVRRLLDKGDLRYAKRSEGVSYRSGVLLSSVEERLENREGMDRLGRIADLLEKNGINPNDVGKVERIRLNDWQGFYKDDDGVAHKVDMEAASVVLQPESAVGPAWPVVQPANPVIIHSVRRVPVYKRFKTAVILPDVQIGYWRDIQSEQLDPFHDEDAMDIALQIIDSVDPDLIINLGDLLDLPEFGKYQQEPTFARTTQAALNRSHQWLAQQRASAPDAEIRFMEGNHDRRMQNFVVQNAKAAFGIQRANTPEEWPVLSVPYLLRLDELNVHYIPGYPANITWINDNLACIHGSKVRSSGSTAAAVIDDERVSVIFGHIHRVELQHKTRQTRAGGKSNFAASLGCLSRIDGTVPSTKGAVDPFGRPLVKYENWQQALGVVTYEEGDGSFHLETIPIHSGTAIFRGEAYQRVAKAA